MSHKKATVGASLAALVGFGCPLCWGPAAVFLSSIGLGFAINLKVILPALFILLFIAWWGMYESYKHSHHEIAPLVVSIVAGLMIPLGRYYFFSITMSDIGIGLLIGTALWNWNLIKACKRK